MNLLIFLIITLSGIPLYSPFSKIYFVVWNVGQGQWTTAVTPDHCLHFDMGGEYFPWKKVSEICQKKKNQILLSHWDWDHIGGLTTLRKNKSLLPQTCLLVRPLGESNKKKSSLLQLWPPCKRAHEKMAIERWQGLSEAKSSNGKSHVFMYRNILIPGDSTQSEELRWLRQPWVSRSRVLILGHHGSKTSTSEALLEALPRLRMAVSSARWARYRHPHSQVETRLRQVKVPLLRTEDWGNIWFEQDNSGI